MDLHTVSFYKQRAAALVFEDERPGTQISELGHALTLAILKRLTNPQWIVMCQVAEMTKEAAQLGILLRNAEYSDRVVLESMTKTIFPPPPTGQLLQLTEHGEKNKK
jgi:hypothetical protein